MRRSTTTGHRKFVCAAFACTLASTAAASEQLALEVVVAQGVEHSPRVQAARHRLAVAESGRRAARLPLNPVLELAPGVGFTNGNAVISQQLDVSGRRSGEARVARGLEASAVSQLRQERLAVAGEVGEAYLRLCYAAELRAAAVEQAALAERLLGLVRAREEIGEAPRVQVTRAEVELETARQEVIRREGELASQQAALNILIGRKADASWAPADRLTVPPPAELREVLLRQALDRRPEPAVARALLAAREGQVELTRAARRPELFAEVAGDFWSLDRRPFDWRNVGVQARLALPLFDRGRLRAAGEQARAGVQEQTAEVKAVEQALQIEVERALVQDAAARKVAAAFEAGILPRSRELLAATERGFAAGLSSFLEVMEAQRLWRQTQRDYLEAVYGAARARWDLHRAVGSVPGMEETADAEAKGERK